MKQLSRAQLVSKLCSCLLGGGGEASNLVMFLYCRLRPDQRDAGGLRSKVSIKSRAHNM
jgi:hypothetical protein